MQTDCLAQKAFAKIKVGEEKQQKEVHENHVKGLHKTLGK